MAKRTIRQLMTEVPAEARDTQWLIEALQNAVELELSTLPPYLCAYWSVKDSNNQVAQLILSIALQEMSHMGLSANMLTSIGGPVTINQHIPTYPGHLPGDVAPTLTVYLAGLSTTYLHDVCMAIEEPEGGPIATATLQAGFATIGQFYDAIAATIVLIKPTFTGKNQMSSNIASDAVVSPINTQQDALTAIDTIKQQGEGTKQSPDEAAGSSTLAHYYKFAEIYNGKTLVQVDGKWEYAGDPIPFPDVWPMATVPAGGWQNAPSDVAALLKAANTAYTSLLDNLQKAWQNGDPNALNNAINDMFDLETPAQKLMTISGAPGGGNWGPDFLYLGSS
jgi:hypothetical protein